MKYKPVIGLETHVELATNSKMFCGCPANHFGVEPNTHTCPVCLGLPGALPVPNQKAIDWTIMIGLALGCTINKESKFDRKHYFYPDLPKGYQISQYDQPFCVNGQVTLDSGKVIRITRVHLEEDTGKLIHDHNVSLVDFNRSGVPLVEIVTEPDIATSDEAKEYAQKIHQLVRDLKVSDADMEKGSMRLEANISLARSTWHVASCSQKNNHKLQATGYKLPSYKVEVKNLNSFRFLKAAIEYEVERQAEILDRGETPDQETRGWSEAKAQTVSQRSKEEAHDYRYFPEPDIPPLRFTPEYIDSLAAKLPKTSTDRLSSLSAHGIPDQIAKLFAKDEKLSELVLKVMEKAGGNDKAKIANWLNHHRDEVMGKSPEEILKQYLAQTATVGDEKQLEIWVSQVINENPGAVNDYKTGKTAVIGFLIGQVQRLAQGKAAAPQVKQLLEQKLN